MPEIIFRRNAVLEALRAGRRELRRLVVENEADPRLLKEVLAEARRRNVPVTQRPRQEFNSLTRGEPHQGLALEVGAYPYAYLDEILTRAQRAGQKPFVLLLDQVQDPANVGRLLRTADAAGMHGVIMPDRHSGDITPAVVTASAGASEHMLICRVSNVAQTIDALKDDGVWFAGLDLAPAAQQIDQVDLNRPLGIVVGNEGAGMRRLVRDKCDILLRLPMGGHVQSLNAAIAGSIVIYAAWQARGWS